MNLRSSLLVLVLSAPLFALGQPMLDSLKQVLRTLPADTSSLPVITEILRNTVFGQPDTGLVYAARYQAIARKSGIHLEIGKGHNYAGMCYSAMTEQDKALAEYLKALREFEQGTDPWYTAMAHNNIGSIYEKEERFDDAIPQYRQARRIFAELRDTVWEANVSNNLGNIHYVRKAYDSAAVLYTQAIELLGAVGMHAFAAQIRMNLGNLYGTQGDHAQALRMMRSARAGYPRNEVDLNLASILINLGRQQGFNGISDSALLNIRQGLQLATTLHAGAVVADAEEFLAEYYEERGRPDSALVHFKRMRHVEDSLLNAERSAQIAEMQVKYESGKKDVELAENRAKLERRDLTIKAVAAGAVLLLLSGLFAFRAYRVKKRTSEALAMKNAIIDGQLKEKELLLREIHHRVKNNLQVVSSLLSIQSRGITDDKAREAVRESRDRVKSMALIHQDLYKENDLTGIDMQGYIAKLARSLISSHQLDPSNITLVTDIAPLNLDVDTAIPLGLILNEVITNALKYAWPDGRAGTLHIALSESSGMLHLVVQDDGDGMPHNATEQPQGTGFGLNMIRTFSSKLNAEHTIRSEGGTVVELQIRNFKLAS